MSYNNFNNNTYYLNAYLTILNTYINAKEREVYLLFVYNSSVNFNISNFDF